MGIAAHIQDLLKKSASLLILLLLCVFLVKPAQSDTIEVGGVLNQNTTWTPENTYIVTDNVRVLFGIILTIEAGTVVKFNQGRGLRIEGGRLYIEGTEAHPVQMLPNHINNESWTWDGIRISAVNQPGNVLIQHAWIEKAVIGINVISSSNLIITNNVITDNLFMGVSLTNSSFCLLENNIIKNNFLGLDIYASDPGNQSAENVVRRNNFQNHTTNIILHNNNHGSCPGNVFEENLLQDAVHGLWLFNSSHGGSGHAHVQRNIIINHGNANDGTGIYVAMDSTIITNNIFWRNTTAVDFNQANKSAFVGNSVFENRRGINLRNASQRIQMQDNTFSGNQTYVISFRAAEEIFFNGNNILGNRSDSAIVRNLTPENIDITGNFWNTTNDSIIQRLLSDFYDDASFGELIFQPVLDEASTIAPVSPPQDFVGQIVNDNLRLRWKPNPEIDLLGYKIYYGDFKNYQFSQSTGLLAENMFFFPFDFPENIAITALNQSHTGNDDQLSGNESPFAMVRLAPYAGEDTLVCQFAFPFLLDAGTIPPGLVSPQWLTSGDGFFENPEMIRTSYTPGSADIEAGEVYLVLQAFYNDEKVTDTLHLQIARLPLVNAGEDAIISKESVFETSDASAAYFTHLQWVTTGDGTFQSADSLLTIYTPGILDIEQGEVKLILEAFSGDCGMAADTLTLFIRSVFQVEGWLWAGNQPVPNNPLMAVYFNETTDVSSRVLTFTDFNGAFRFNELFEGSYLFYAPADTLNFSGFLPTYHAERIHWQDAFMHNISGDTYEIDIRLNSLEGVLPSGNGMIRGIFSLAETVQNLQDGYCLSWFDPFKTDLCRQGLSNAAILLYGASGQRVYGYTLTDSDGFFSFRDLPYGRYIIRAEMAGFTSLPSEVIELSPAFPVHEGVELSIAEMVINVFVPAHGVSPKNLLAFPNPAGNFLFVQSDYDFDEQPLSVNVFDMKGTLRLSTKAVFSGGIMKLDVSHLPSGIYTAIIFDKRDVLNVKFFKK